MNSVMFHKTYSTQNIWPECLETNAHKLQKSLRKGYTTFQNNWLVVIIYLIQVIRSYRMVHLLNKKYILLLPLTILLLNFKLWKFIFQKEKLKTLLQYFLQVILMQTRSFGILMATELQKVQKLKNSSLN